jgi:hypothetical protein
MNKFYVYALLDPRKRSNFVYGEFSFEYEPFYIGKGCGTRMYAHACKSEISRDRNPYKTRKIKKILAAHKKPIIHKISCNLLEDQAYLKLIGRKNINNKYPLTNIDIGGRTAPTLTDEEKRKISETHKRQYRSGKRIHPWIGRKHSKSSIQKIKDNHSSYWLNNSHHEKTKKKISFAAKGKRLLKNCNKYKLVSPSGKIYIVETGLKYFCKRHKLTYSCVRKIISGKQKHHKKWLITKINTKNTGKSKKYSIISPFGKKYTITNLSQFCKEHDLQKTLMSRVAKGEREHHKKWRCSLVKDC